MKTITLTDQAHKRLKVVPEKGTLGQMLEDVGQMKPLSARQAKVMEETMKWGRDPGKSCDRWTSWRIPAS